MIIILITVTRFVALIVAKSFQLRKIGPTLKGILTEGF